MFALPLVGNGDTPITEKLDYFSAALAFLYALYYATICLYLYPALERSRLLSPLAQNESQAETPIDPLHFDISGLYFLSNIATQI